MTKFILKMDEVMLFRFFSRSRSKKAIALACFKQILKIRIGRSHQQGRNLYTI